MESDGDNLNYVQLFRTNRLDATLASSREHQGGFCILYKQWEADFKLNTTWIIYGGGNSVLL
jgi:hypothetical protein